VFFIDSERKAQYLTDAETLLIEEPLAYTAEYTFSGHDEYGTAFSTVATTTFSIGKYSICDTPPALSVSPTSISLTGIANPDGDASDDVTFYISGGIEPYTVYSDDISVIESPTVNADGTFTIDPDAVTTERVVTLTVVDSDGASITAQVTVKP
jgi:hypothetical protein